MMKAARRDHNGKNTRFPRPFLGRRSRRYQARGLQAAAAARQPAAEEVHPRFERHLQAATNQLVELPIRFRGASIEPGPARRRLPTW
jgi:hypothetical protein